MSDLLEGRLEGASRIAIMGVGSELRADDVAGLLVARRLKNAFRRRKNILVVEGCTAPENLTGEILRFKASHLIIIDCAELDEEPGSYRLFPVKDMGGMTSNTHSLPLSIIIDYLQNRQPCETLVVGIQPKTLVFDGLPSTEALEAAKRVADLLIGAIAGTVKTGTVKALT